MTIYLFNIFTLLLSLLSFILFGFFFAILAFPKFVKNKIEENKYIELILLLFGLSITSNIILGYILDIFFIITWQTHVISLVILAMITLYFRWNYFKNSKKIIILIIKDIFHKFKKKNYFLYFSISIIFFLFFLNIFNYAFWYFSIPTTDPIHMSANIRYSLFYRKITYVTTTNETWIGLLNWKDTHYPQGLLIILNFLCCYDSNNIFIIIKFFGLFINLISLLSIYYICRKITDNRYAGIVGMLAWISSSFINNFSTITIASTFSISILLLSILFLFNDAKTSKIISGILFGGAFLIHPVIGTFFLLPGILLYFLIQFLQKKKKFFFKFFIFSIIIVIIPYILLFKYPQFNINNSILNIATFEAISSNSYVFSFINLENNWLKDLTGQPTLMFYIFSFFGIFYFKKNKALVSLFSLMFIISFLFVINPFVLNGVPLIEIFNQYYLNARGIFPLTISITFLSSLGMKKIIDLMKNINENINRKRIRNFNKNLTSKFIVILLIFSQATVTFDHIKSGYGFFWPHNIPEEYTEVILWISQNIRNENSIIVPNETWGVSDEIKIVWYYQTFLFGYNLVQNNSFYQDDHIFEYQELFNMSFFNFDYIILQNYNLISYEINSSSVIDLQYNSCTGEFLLFRILHN